MRLERESFHRLPPLLVSAGDIVSETKAKANLLNDVFVHQNTSLNPDAVVFGPSPLKHNIQSWKNFSFRNKACSEISAKQGVMRTGPKILSDDEGGWSRVCWPSGQPFLRVY